MKVTRWARFLGCFGLLASHLVLGAEALPQDNFLPIDATEATWVFSGVVANEQGQNYGYFFQMQRQHEKLHVIASLIDSETQKVLVLEDAEAPVVDAKTNQWTAGRAFLKFNPINQSWVFGLQPKSKLGFNFKVDMLTQPGGFPIAQDLRPGVAFLVTQTGRLNGHIQTGSENAEQFVTAKNAWFRQVWLSSAQTASHPLTGVFCQFKDGSGFYSLNLREADALRGAVAGWINAEGGSVMMSQFITIKHEDNGPLHLRLGSPSLHLILPDPLHQDSIIAGFTAPEKPGFCMLSQEKLGVMPV